MSWIIHHTIAVTDWKKQDIEKARSIAITCIGEQLVTPIFSGIVNAQFTFFIVPDGSKEGWFDSDDLDAKRKLFLDQLRDSGLYCDYIEVQFGGDHGSDLTSIIRHGNSDLKEEN